MENYINLSHSGIYKINIGLVSYGTSILNLSFNNISIIENLPNTIKILYIHHNNIIKINELPKSLEIIYIDNPNNFKFNKNIIICKPTK
jgi:hypothetical protein